MTYASQNLETLVTIGDLLSDRSLSATASVLPRGGEHRPVSWVHATEQLDPRPHLRRDELVCTLGSSLVRPRSSGAFVNALNEAGVAGIALGLGEVHLEPPDELRDVCNQLGMPLLLLEHGVPFLAVNDSVLKRRNQIENEARKRESSLLSQLLTRARNGAEEDALLREASDALGGEIKRVAEEGRNLLVWKADSDAPTTIFMDQLGSLLEYSGLEQARESFEQQQRLGQLVNFITDGLAHPAAILPDIESRGLDAKALRVSFWPVGSEGAIGCRWGAGLIGTTSREVMLITGAETDESFSTLGLVCGYSAVVPLSGLRRAFNEARAALRLARSRGGVAGPGQLASIEALLEQQSPEQLAPFVEQLAEPIIRADEEGRGELMTTLSAFIAADRQLQVTAERLFVHVNTVRYRLAKVHELSGRDPLTLAGIFDLRTAVWAVERNLTLRHRMIKPLGR